MKRMRYLAGAAGLAPAALGIAVPTAASAAAAPAGPANAKTVSLHHVLAATARAGAAAVSSSSSQAGSPVSPAAPCNGDTYFRIPQAGNLKGHGWYANSNFDFKTCIGTVDVWVHFTKNICKDATLSVGTATASHPWVRHHSVCGSAGHSRMTQFNVHQWFNHEPGTEGIFVCASSTYQHNQTCREVGS